MWEPLLIYQLQLGNKLSTRHIAKLGQPTYTNTESVLPSLCGGDIRFNFLQNKTASSTYNKLLTKEQILETKLNSHIAYKAPNATGTRTYPIQLFCNNDDKVVNKYAIPVCLYNGVWHQIAHDSNSGSP